MRLITPGMSEWIKHVSKSMAPLALHGSRVVQDGPPPDPLADVEQRPRVWLAGMRTVGEDDPLCTSRTRTTHATVRTAATAPAAALKPSRPGTAAPALGRPRRPSRCTIAGMDQNMAVGFGEPVSERNLKALPCIINEACMRELSALPPSRHSIAEYCVELRPRIVQYALGVRNADFFHRRGAASTARLLCPLFPVRLLTLGAAFENRTRGDFEAAIRCGRVPSPARTRSPCCCGNQ